MTPTHPIIRYYGGKWMLAPWIIRHFPPHGVYVEPYGGAASVLLQKPPVTVEVYNDLNGELVNLFRILQDRQKTRDLLRALRFTPYSRKEYQDSFLPASDQVEAARRLIVRHLMGIDYDLASSGFRVRKQAGAGAPPSQTLQRYLKQFMSYVKRMKTVTIEHDDALAVIKRYDSPDTLLYVDPPYVSSTRNSKKKYHTELSDHDHRNLADVLNSAASMVALSAYDCPLYRELYPHWKAYATKSRVNGEGSRTETLLLNQRAAANCAQLSLFE